MLLSAVHCVCSSAAEASLSYSDLTVDTALYPLLCFIISMSLQLRVPTHHGAWFTSPSSPISLQESSALRWHVLVTSATNYKLQSMY